MKICLGELDFGISDHLRIENWWCKNEEYNNEEVSRVPHQSERDDNLAVIVVRETSS